MSAINSLVICIAQIVRDWGSAEPRGTVYMYYERLMVSLFCCVVVWVVSVCGGLTTESVVTSIFDTCLPTICETNSLVLRLAGVGTLLVLVEV